MANDHASTEESDHECDGHHQGVITGVRELEEPQQWRGQIDGGGAATEVRHGNMGADGEIGAHLEEGNAEKKCEVDQNA